MAALLEGVQDHSELIVTELQPKQLQPVQQDQLDASVVRKRQQDFEEIPPAKKCKEEYSDFFVFDGEENKEK